MSDVSMIGLGAMGTALARTLLEAGYSVTVWNRTGEKAEALVAAGASRVLSVKAAVKASPATIVCIATPAQTIELLNSIAPSLQDKTVIELSNGTADEAQSLSELLTKNGSRWLIGTIHSYPSAIGKSDTVLTMVGEEEVWEIWKPVIKTLGGNSSHVGTEPRVLAPLAAALFTARQGWMFGMIYGGWLAKRVGIPLGAYADQLRISLGVLESYYESFSETVPESNFDNTQASLATHADAYDVFLKVFQDNGVPSELPQLYSDLAHKGLDAGLGGKALTALVTLPERSAKGG